MFIQIQNGSPYGLPITLNGLQKAIPNVSFSLPISKETLSSFNFAEYVYSVKPENVLHKVLFEDNPDVIDGVVYQKWSYRDMNELELAEETKSQADKIRKERNLLLKETDWTQLNDASLSLEMKQKWAEYRTSLRDITNQNGFPWSVTFPDVPYEEPNTIPVTVV